MYFWFCLEKWRLLSWQKWNKTTDQQQQQKPWEQQRKSIKWRRLMGEGRKTLGKKRKLPRTRERYQPEGKHTLGNQEVEKSMKNSLSICAELTQRGLHTDVLHLQNNGSSQEGYLALYLKTLAWLGLAYVQPVVLWPQLTEIWPKHWWRKEGSRNCWNCQAHLDKSLGWLGLVGNF